MSVVSLMATLNSFRDVNVFISQPLGYLSSALIVGAAIRVVP
ncbi:MAG: hypothetical protein QXR84_09445 [Candidatus Bathyarchaeia archaeon]